MRLTEAGITQKEMFEGIPNGTRCSLTLTPAESKVRPFNIVDFSAIFGFLMIGNADKTVHTRSVTLTFVVSICAWISS